MKNAIRAFVGIIFIPFLVFGIFVYLVRRGVEAADEVFNQFVDWADRE